jgi:hypothetical protein
MTVLRRTPTVRHPILANVRIVVLPHFADSHAAKRMTLQVNPDPGRANGIPPRALMLSPGQPSPPDPAHRSSKSRCAISIPTLTDAYADIAVTAKHDTNYDTLSCLSTYHRRDDARPSRLK